MESTALTLLLAPVIRTVPFSDFVGLVRNLIAEHGTQLSFTDGYVFGAATSISLDYGVDTLVPGLDSSYHCCDIQPDHEFGLTKYGFRSQAESDEVQFNFVKRTVLPDGIGTLGELAAFLAKNPHLQLVTRYEPFEEGATLEGESALKLEVNGNRVDVLELNHFEGFEVIGERKSGSNPIMLAKGQNAPLPTGQFTFRDRLEDLNHLMHLGNRDIVYFMLIEPLAVQW